MPPGPLHRHITDRETAFIPNNILQLLEVAFQVELVFPEEHCQIFLQVAGAG